MTSTAKLGRHLNSQRTQNRLSLRQVAEEVDLSHTHLWRLENGKTQKITRNVVAKLSQYFELPEDMLTEAANGLATAIKRHGQTQDTVITLLREIRDELRRQNTKEGGVTQC